MVVYGNLSVDSVVNIGDFYTVEVDGRAEIGTICEVGKERFGYELLSGETLDQAKGIILRDSGGQGLEFLVGKKVSKKLEKLFWDSS